MSRTASRTILVVFVVAIVAAGALLVGRITAKQPAAATGTPAPAGPPAGSGLAGTPGPAPGSTATAAANERQGQTRAWVESSLDSLGVGVQLPIPAGTKGLGAAVATVRAGSPAQRAGVRQGDTIVSFDKKTVGSPMDLAEFIDQAQPSDRYVMVVERGGKQVTLQVSGVSPSKVRPAAASGT